MSDGMRPILFSGRLVRAILAGRKTQTRLVVRGTEAIESIQPVEGGKWASYCGGSSWAAGPKCPYGNPGDLLWVRESTYRVEDHGYAGPVFVASEMGDRIAQAGLGPEDDAVEFEPHEVRKRPSIHMPRDYARLFLRVVSVRAERLQEITPEDVAAEGVGHGIECGELRLPLDADLAAAFPILWDSINEERGHGWHSNPWVWVVEFEPDIRRIRDRGLCTEHQVEDMERATRKVVR